MKSLPWLALVLLACNNKAEDTSTDGDDVVDRPERFDAVADALEQALSDNVAPAVSIAIYEGGEVVWAEAFGTKSDGGDVAPTTDTLFQLGSTTKMFTAVAMLQGVDAGHYTLDDDLLTLLPDLNARDADFSNWEGITPHRLVSQQTGLLDYVDWSEDADSNLASISLDDYPSQSPFMNPPGEFFNYSNPNFSYAGLIAQVAEDEPYTDLMVNNVFVPLGMSRTTMVRDDVQADGDYALGAGLMIRPNGQARQGSAESLDDVPHSPFGRPAGVSTWTTPTELTQMAQFLIHGDTDVLSDALRTEMTTAHAPLLVTPDDVGYGYGIFVRPGVALTDGYRETPVWEHGGNTLQYTCAFYVLPELDYAVAVMSSGYATDFSATIGAALAVAPGLPAPTDDPEYTIDTTRFSDHVGYYDGPSNLGDVIIEERDGGLMWTLPLLDSESYPYEHELQTISSTVFLAEIDGGTYDITFIGEAGSPSTFIRNRSFVGIRGDAPMAATQQSATPSLAPSLLGPGGSLRPDLRQ